MLTGQHIDALTRRDNHTVAAVLAATPDIAADVFARLPLERHADVHSALAAQGVMVGR